MERSERIAALREARAGQLPALTTTLLDPVLRALKRRHIRQVEHLPDWDSTIGVPDRSRPQHSQRTTG
jgi:hypothetical protein